MAIGADTYVYTASNETENIGLREISLLDIVSRSLGVLVRVNALWRFIEKGSRVPVTNPKAMWPSLPEQKSCHFSVREGENIDVGTAYIDIA